MIRQYNLGAKVGGLRLQAANALFYVSAFQLLLVGLAAIGRIQQTFPWFSIFMLVGLMVLVFIMGVLFEHFVMYKAVVTYSTGQAYIEQNPAAVDLKYCRRKIEEMEGKVNEIHNRELGENIRSVGDSSAQKQNKE